MCSYKVGDVVLVGSICWGVTDSGWTMVDAKCEILSIDNHTPKHHKKYCLITPTGLYLCDSINEVEE